MIVHVNLRQVSVRSASHLSKYWHQYHGQRPGCCWQVRSGHAHADMCAHVCIQQERDGCADRAVLTGLPEARPATARKEQGRARAQATLSLKGSPCIATGCHLGE